MLRDQIQVNIPASEFSKLRSALCRVGCGNPPNEQEAVLLHDLMKILDAAQAQLLGGSFQEIPRKP
tara:strand:+ start:87 stop:284 length:198 start_codon:yes stop_codon:yes gene_type:complete